MVDVVSAQSGQILRMRTVSGNTYIFVLTNPNKREGHLMDNRSRKYHGLFTLLGPVDKGQPVFFLKDGALDISTTAISSVELI